MYKIEGNYSLPIRPLQTCFDQPFIIGSESSIMWKGESTKFVLKRHITEIKWEVNSIAKYERTMTPIRSWFQGIACLKTGKKEEATFLNWQDFVEAILNLYLYCMMIHFFRFSWCSFLHAIGAWMHAVKFARKCSLAWPISYVTNFVLLSDVNPNRFCKSRLSATTQTPEILIVVWPYDFLVHFTRWMRWI